MESGVVIMRRYLGSKIKLLNEIDTFIDENIGKVKRFYDGFAGTGIVSSFFASKDKIDVVANDYMYFSYCNLKGFSDADVNIEKIKGFVTNINNEWDLVGETLENSFIASNYSPIGGRKYFSTENAKIIDFFRQKIEELYQSGELNETEYYLFISSLINSVQGVSNITGTYSAFLKKWDSRALKRIKIEINNKEIKRPISAHNMDVHEFVKSVPQGSVLYLDPPYTSLDYAGAYHLLETIARYDAPIISGISGRRSRTNVESNFHKKSKAYNEFVSLFSKIKPNVDVVLSYSSHGILSKTEMIEAIAKNFPLSKITIKELKYNQYKNIRESEKGDLYEYLIHFKTHKPIKAPFNYQGSKEGIVNFARAYIPKGTKKIIEPFAGGFNFGINTYVDDFELNDYSGNVINLLKMFYTLPTETLVNKVKSAVSKFKLKPNDRESYLQLRAEYNRTKRPELLLVLLLFTFNFQIRFNSSNQFNNPVGLAGFSELKNKQIKEFSKIIKTKNITFLNQDFRDMNFNQIDALYYFDPPYLITTASYNDGKRGGTGWNVAHEEELLSKILNLSRLGGKFMLSNVISHKGKTNHILKSWIEVNNFNVYTIKYKDREEVIITNYKH